MYLLKLKTFFITIKNKKRIPDEKLNTSTTGRSNAILLNHDLNENDIDDLSNDQKNTQRIENINTNEKEHVESNGNRLESFHNEEDQNISNDLDQSEVDDFKKCSDIFLNAKEIIFLTMVFSLNLWIWIFFKMDFFFFSFAITVVQIIYSIYLIIKLKKRKSSHINIAETLNVLLITVKIFF